MPSKGRFSPSRFKDIMTKGRGKDQPFGLTAFSYADDIVMDILGVEPEPEYTSREMQWGIDNEFDAVVAYQAFTGAVVDVPAEVIVSDQLPIAGTPDGLIKAANGLIEIKCPNNRNHLNNLTREKSQIDLYYWQMQGYMMLTGAEWCDFVSYSPNFPEGLQLGIHRVERNDSDISELTERIQVLWDYVQERVTVLKNKLK